MWALIAMAACSDYGLVSTEIVAEPGVPHRTCAPVGRPAEAAPSECTVEPTVAPLEARVEWTWDANPVHPGFHQVMSTPAVADLTDDDGDGVVDERDVPDVVFTAFADSGYRQEGALVAVSGDDGRTLFSTRGVEGARPWGASGVAVADLDGPALLVATTGGLSCFGPDGTHRWTTAVPLPADGDGHPATADLDGDGRPEILFGAAVLDADGALLWLGEAGDGAFASFAADLDGDGALEVIAGTTAYEASGAVRWDFGGDGVAAAGDLDGDGLPEVVVARPDRRRVEVLDGDGERLWTAPLDDADGPAGGAPVLADFDGDGLAEVGIASQRAYYVLDGDGRLLWRAPIRDDSSRGVGSTVFDFDRDGFAEVVVADEETLWVLDGATGATELAWRAHSSGTLREYPVVADVDGDGAAEVVVPANDYAFAGSRGIAALGGREPWPQARRTWEQYALAPSADGFRSSPAGPPQVADVALGELRACPDACAEGIASVWVSVESRAWQTGAELSLYGGGRELHREALDLDAATTRWVGPLAVDVTDVGPEGIVVVVEASGDSAECIGGTRALWIDRHPCL